MAKHYPIPLWKVAPFVRLLLPLMMGIVMQWYLQLSLFTIIIFASVTFLFFIAFSYLHIQYKFTFLWVHGVLLKCILVCFGAFLCNQKDVQNSKNWYGKYYTDSSTLLVHITEPLVEKEKSYKAIGEVKVVIQNGSTKNTNGKLLIYFTKNEAVVLPTYGSTILIQGGLQKIKNSGNPGGFNYSRYMVFQQTTHQVYLKESSFVITNRIQKNFVYDNIYKANAFVIASLRKYIIGSKKVVGIAEALLIGYKEDLDKDVVQAYSNTGVVHIIAISGMHLGLIYVGLVWLMGCTPLVKKSAIARVVIILSCLWLFSLLTGGSASVLRSAVMFTCIIIGKEFFTQASIYNSLATSAFLLLCYNPFLLWDVGFQLSYCAIVGIVWLQKPIENLYYSRFATLRYIWQMCSITLAAQILTLPVCIYYFHQIPTTFLFTNLICVPLSTLILFAEIGLVACAAFPPLASILGKFVYVLTWSMNKAIYFFNQLPFSLIDNIYATALTTWALYGFFIFIAAALLRKNKSILNKALLFLMLFISFFIAGKAILLHQKKLIIYHVSKHTAIDFIAKNNYYFLGDEEFLQEGALQNFNLKPCRILLQTKQSIDTLPSLKNINNLWQFYNKRILIISEDVQFEPLQSKILIDVIVVCKNPDIDFDNITSTITPTTIVFDGSNSMWKIKQWKKQCEDLHLQYFDTNEQGAFILDANK